MMQKRPKGKDLRFILKSLHWGSGWHAKANVKVMKCKAEKEKMSWVCGSARQTASLLQVHLQPRILDTELLTAGLYIRPSCQFLTHCVVCLSSPCLSPLETGMLCGTVPNALPKSRWMT